MVRTLLCTLGVLCALLVPTVWVCTCPADTVYSWTNFVGQPGGFGNADGTGRDARFNYPYGVAVDAGGNVYVADASNHTIRKVTPGGVVTTLAGLAGSPGSSDGTGSAARFNNPSGVAVDAGGNVYVADENNRAIRKVTPGGVVTTLASGFGYLSGVAVDAGGNVYMANMWTIDKVTLAGVVTTLAGQVGSYGSSDGTGSAARFDNARGVAVDAGGNVYVAEYGSHTIRKVTPGGVVTTVAGLAGSDGSSDGTGSAARFHYPEGVAVDAGGNVYVADTGNYTIRKVTPGGVVSTLAGLAGNSGSSDGTGSAARFDQPRSVAVDAGGNVYVADSANQTIRKVTPGGVVTTLAGGAYSSGSNDGTGSAARFDYSQGVAVDAGGNLYVADTSNHTIRKVTPGGVVTTLAGRVGYSGSSNGTGSAARFYRPYGVAVDAGGSIYVGDTWNDTIRKVTPGGVVTTLAGAGHAGSSDGTGSAAGFRWPYGITVDAGGNVYVADNQNYTIRKVTPAGVVTTLAGLAGTSGSNDGTGSAARFYNPTGVAVNSGGNVYVADNQNHTIRKVTPGGVVSTLAGLAGNSGSSDGTGSAARFYNPTGVAVNSGGNVYVADSGNNTIRKVTPAGVVTTIGGIAGVIGGADGLGAAANFSSPAGVAIDPSGQIYVADAGNNRISKGTPSLAPGSPGPADGQVDVALDASLSWSGAADGMTFDVYLDTVNPPVAKVASGQSGAALAATLDPATTYYWQVVVISAAGQTPGPVWSFLTHIPGDTNGDASVDVLDLLTLAAAYGSVAGDPNYDPAADFNSDGSVDVNDLLILVKYFGKQ